MSNYYVIWNDPKYGTSTTRQVANSKKEARAKVKKRITAKYGKSLKELGITNLEVHTLSSSIQIKEKPQSKARKRVGLKSHKR